MKKFRLRSHLVHRDPVERAAFGMLLGLGLTMLACSGRDATSLRGESALLPQRPQEGALRVGTVALALSVEGVSLSQLSYVVENPDGQVVLADSQELGESDGPELSFDAPPGAGYRIRVSGEGGAGVSCSGSARFDVVAGASVEVPLTLVCEDAGRVSVVGSLVAPSVCPDVSIAASTAPVEVGTVLQLAAAPAASAGISYVWASSGGTLTNPRSAAATFQCTEAGPVTLSLTVSGEGCTDAASVEVTCQALAASACAGLGSSCHVVDPGSGPLHECHELGHGGDEAACSAGRAACVTGCGEALCQTLGSLCHPVDPGSGPLHECHELGHAGDANACFARGRECFDLCTEARASQRQPLTLSFQAKVGDEAFACGRSYEDVGSTGVTVEPRDLRVFVSNVMLVKADGTKEAVEIVERAPWQLPGVALLDFEDASGLCAAGTAEVNATISARVFPGEYVGVSFEVGVPEDLNHDDPATLAAPLELGTMSWGWLLGFKFLVAELEQTGVPSAPGQGLLHLGSTSCTGSPAAGTVVCAKPNRASVQLTGFNAATNSIALDVGALFQSTDLGQDASCHSSGVCAGAFEQLGLSFASGQPAGTQSVFSVE
jgi:uncharacterized repeat protein (TIGR04052 family)